MAYLFYNENEKTLTKINKGDEPTLKFFYNTLNCDMVQVVMFNNGIGAWVDENALLTGNYTHVHNIQDGGLVHSMVGNIVFTGTDGEEVGELTDEQIGYIKNSIKINTETAQEYLERNKSEYNDGI